jgi:hypothetical protein
MGLFGKSKAADPKVKLKFFVMPQFCLYTIIEIYI